MDVWFYYFCYISICFLDSSLRFRFGRMAFWDVDIIYITGLMLERGFVWEARHARILVLK